MENKTEGRMIKYPALILLLLLPACRNRLDTGFPSSAGASESKIEGFSVAQTISGQREWEMVSKSAVISDRDKKVYLDGVNAVFYNKGKYSSTLVAKKGYMDTVTNDIYGDGGCLVTTYRGETLETEQIYFKSDANRIFSDKDIKLTQEDGVIYGKGLEATPDLELIVIKKQNIETQ